MPVRRASWHSDSAGPETGHPIFLSHDSDRNEQTDPVSHPSPAAIVPLKSQPRPDPSRDVAAFIERRNRCDHFRGVPDGGPDQGPEQKARAEEIRRALMRNRPGTDRQLVRLKQKYADAAGIMAILNEYGERTEWPLRAAFETRAAIGARTTAIAPARLDKPFPPVFIIRLMSYEYLPSTDHTHSAVVAPSVIVLVLITSPTGAGRAGA
ncbi:MAG: hypothetical protein LBL59_07720 [Xanthomonadaceae bacterium]|jgi:hypothetical protein|nr:hypothetical protein [Xanthomonadaceae bacterium]